MTGKLQPSIQQSSRLVSKTMELTPAMNNPNDMPSSPRSWTFQFVSAGLQRLPGLSNFENPSIKTTITMSKVEMTPSIEVYDNKDNGIRVVGIMLH